MGMNSDIILDVTRLIIRLAQGRALTGIDRVSLAYVEQYHRHASAVMRYKGRHFFYTQAASRIIFEKLLRRERQTRTQLALLYLKDILALRRPRKNGSILINVSHSGVDNPAYAPRLKSQGIRPVYMVHDLIPLSHPEYFVAGEKERHIERVKNILKGSAIIANSSDTMKALRDFAVNNNLPLPQTAAAPLGTTPLAVPLSVQRPDKPYFVMLGTIEPRKNHLLILNIWRMLAQKMGNETPALVIIGHRGWECENIIDMIDRCEVLSDHVTEIKGCSDDELATCLKGASALLFPSFAEGFGLPLCEAISLGVPVIAADLPVFREVAGDVPEYIAPINGPAWAEAVTDYMQADSQRARDQKNRMKGFTPVTWNDHFAIVEDLLNNLGRAHG